MLASLNAIKYPQPGGHSKLGGPGAFPQGSYLDNQGGHNAGSYLTGIIGKEFAIQQDDVAKFSSALAKSLGATIGATLLPFGQCIVQWVQTVAGSTQAPTAGQLAYWSDRAAFTVTPDPDANNSKVAGVYLYTPAKGDYVLLATFGDVSVKCKATLTNASVAGQAVFAVTDSSLGAIDGQAAATAATVAMINTYVGRALETLVNNTTKRVFINPNFRMI